MTIPCSLFSILVHIHESTVDQTVAEQYMFHLSTEAESYLRLSIASLPKPAKFSQYYPIAFPKAQRLGRMTTQLSQHSRTPFRALSSWGANPISLIDDPLEQTSHAASI